ncbi:MAG TPA: hypothetical protein EYH30_11465 [Anaerolineales bacterium]|nr:hypothetical protein [Anaerolineae bacterium]HIQ02713.1 hypothetical protein [Anaerolineales bacterium]
MGGSIGMVLLLAAGALLAPPAVAAPGLQPPFPEGRSEYFYSTGHYVKGPFLDFFNRHGGVRIFGYPQTEVFYDSRVGLWVQYFDNARMEWHPENPHPYKVQLGLLGELLGHRYPPIPASRVPRGTPFRRYFPETGHSVSFAFLVFYDSNGGLDIFGYPISEPMVENGRIVQYFQRARMEWHPERPRDERVVLGALGRAYIQRFGVPAEYQRRQPAPARPGQLVQTIEETSDLHVWAFVRNVITGREGYQTVYIYVTDAGRRPASGASATIAVRFPSQTVQYTAGPTDSRGITSVTFPIHALPPGQKVIVDVTVRLGQQTQTAQTFFVPWY